MKIILHFGAHKTASSHLQYNLNLNRELLAENGIIYFKFQEIEGLRFEAINIRRNFKNNSFNTSESEKKIRSILEREISGYEMAIISYEGILGDLNQSNYQFIYEDAEELISIYQQILKGHYIVPVFAVRNYDDFLRSTYKYTLKNSRHFSFTLDDYLSRIKAIPNRWTQICDNLNENFNGKLNLYTQEKYRTDWKEIIQRVINLTGKNIPSLKFDSEDRNVSKKKNLLDFYYTTNKLYQKIPTSSLKERFYNSARYRLPKLIENKVLLSLLSKHQKEKIAPINDFHDYKKETDLLKKNYGILK